ncbi:ankyrin repeat-containing protein At5g02620 isoform X1 [Cryptomeria japonica]|uniref:ankyrin repeat-containing protein At5g02620 isoform X1 n=2 Tax=Cryptomeria japonica TaxID=3369 RepID=UPI0025AD989D|nr:ankyrin repeat-containing protein At5g02620 isoform X1 [Cryptomeria japonica]
MDENANFLKGMDSRLYRASVVGSVHTLNQLLRAKLDVLNEVTPLGNSALHIAVSCGNLRFIEKLLQVVNPNSLVGYEFLRAKNSDGNTAVHLAAFHGHDKVVQELLRQIELDIEAGDILRAVNWEGNTALHEAAKGGNEKVLEVLLKHDHHGGLVGALNDAGETALFTACEGGHCNIVQILLPLMTSDKATKRSDGRTPLHSAVFHRHTGVAMMLVEQRPEMVKQADEFGRTALHMAALSPPLSTFQAGLKSYQFTMKIGELLLQKDNSLCYREDKEKKSPLHIAVKEGKYDLVKVILKYARDCRELVDGNGRKPLHLAVISAVRISEESNFAVLFQFKNMLLSLMSKRSLNHRDNSGHTALQIAMRNFDTDPALFSSIKEVLQINGAVVTPEMLEDARWIRKATTKLVFKGQGISINAVLIATVSFAAAFTLPGGLYLNPGGKPTAVFIDSFLFKLFVICDVFSFCTSIASAILAGVSRNPVETLYCIYLLWSALISLLVAFGTAIHLVIQSSGWLTVIVWVMLSFVPITIFVISFHSKQFIFGPERYKIWFVLLFPAAFVMGIRYLISETLYVFFLSRLFLNAIGWVKKKTPFESSSERHISFN